jgi:hypothetical protein
MTTKQVCSTLTGTDISVGAANAQGLATVIVKGAGALSGVTLTVPVQSAESVLAGLGLVCSLYG